MSNRLLPLLIALTLAAAAAGCTRPTATLGVRPAGALDADPAPSASRAPVLLPAVGAAPKFVEVAGGGSLSGTVSLQAIDSTFFRDNGAAYRTLAAMPVQRALLTLNTLEESQLSVKGLPTEATSLADGTFSFSGTAPTDRAYVAIANLARGHRLSAIVPTGATSATLDEASSMIAEMARWQLREAPADGNPDADEKTLQDLDATSLASMHEHTLALLPGVDFGTIGSVPDVAALKAGAGHLLRNLYVKAIGESADAHADALSQAWKDLLGFRPLALTRVAGNGIRDYNQDDGHAARDGALSGPTAAATDDDGNMFIVEEFGHAIRYVPATDGQGPLLGYDGAMTRGNLYTLAGLVNGPNNTDAFNEYYGPQEAAGLADPDDAPAFDDPDPSQRPALFDLHDVIVEQDGAARHLYVTSRFGHRVLLIPGADFNRFGRTFKANRLYTLAGDGAQPPGTFYSNNLGNAVEAATTQMSLPTGLSRDSQGNIYFMDSNIGYVRVIRAADGQCFILRATENAANLRHSRAEAIRVVEGPGGNYVYITDTNRHRVTRLPLPADLTYPTVPDPQPVEVVLGQTNVSGFVDTEQDGVPYPFIYDVNDGFSEDVVLLDRPVGLDFDPDGNLLVADNGRVRLLEADGISPAQEGYVFTLAGGLDTRFLEGDARLCYLPQNGHLRYDASTGTFLLTDRTENLVRRLWTQRGSL